MVFSHSIAYLRREVDRRPSTGIPDPGSVHGTVVRLLVLLRSSCRLRRVVARRRLLLLMIVTTFSANASAPSSTSTNQRCPEPSSSTIRKPRVPSPRSLSRPPEGGEAVGEGLEALAEVCRGHFLFVCFDENFRLCGSKDVFSPRIFRFVFSFFSFDQKTESIF